MQIKAIALLSGGLDSILAVKLMQQQGIKVIAIHFRIPFSTNRSDDISKNYRIGKLGFDLKVIDLSKDFLEIIQNPKHGFGSNLNPCIDCKTLMLRRAKGLMSELGAAFIITGEVLGQRPMSQHKQALSIIERESGLSGLILRPLCAQLLDETTPEKEGWVRRDDLLNFSGRSRRPQIELAVKLDIQDYPNPAGGCLLTDPRFSQRLKDLLAHGALSLENIKLLKIGRHFRISKQAKLIVGRNEGENAGLTNLAQAGDYLFMPQDIAGPTALGRGIFGEELIWISCAITCRYCDLNGLASADIIWVKIPKQQERVFNVIAREEEKLSGLRI